MIAHNQVFRPWQTNPVYSDPTSELYPNEENAQRVYGDNFHCDTLKFTPNENIAWQDELQMVHNVPREAQRDQVREATMFFSGQAGTVVGNINEEDRIYNTYEDKYVALKADDVFPTRRAVMNELAQDEDRPVIAPVLNRTGDFSEAQRETQFAEIVKFCDEHQIKALHLSGESMGANDALAFANYAMAHEADISIKSVAMAVPFDTFSHAGGKAAGIPGALLTSIPGRNFDNVAMIKAAYNNMSSEHQTPYPITIITTGEADVFVAQELQQEFVKEAKKARDGYSFNQDSAPIRIVDNKYADHFFWDHGAIAEAVKEAVAAEATSPDQTILTADFMREDVGLASPSWETGRS